MRRQTPHLLPDLRTSVRPLRRIVPALAAVAVLTAGCGLVDSDEATLAPEPLLESSPADEPAPDADAATTAGSSAGSSSDGSVDGSTAAPADAIVPGPAPVADDGVIASSTAPWAGACGLDQVPHQPIQVVFNIAADDPDGGLNLRSAPVDGDVVRALPNGEVVQALDCEDRGEDGVWWFVEDLGGDAGYVNPRWLTEDLDGATARPRAASEAEEQVERLLSSLAAEDWTGAMETLGQGTVVPELGLALDAVTEPDALIEHCSSRICDAPFEIVGSTGTYHQRWGRPTVSVRFDYPTGSAVEVFEVLLEERPGTTTDGLIDVEALGVRGLPGRSVHGLIAEPVSTAELVAPSAASPVDDGLLAAAEQVRTSLLSQSGPRIPADLVAPEGVVISLDAYVSSEADERVSVTPDDLAARADQRVLWGFADGSGHPVVETLDERLHHYRSDLALLTPDTVAIDRRVGVSTTIANLGEVFPNATVVEYHWAGRGDLVDFVWNSVRLAFEPRAEGWTLVAITSDYWTT